MSIPPNIESLFFQHNLLGNPLGTLSVPNITISNNQITYSILDEQSDLSGSIYDSGNYLSEYYTSFATGTNYKSEVESAFLSVFNNNDVWGSSFNQVLDISFVNDVTGDGVIRLGQATGSLPDFSGQLSAQASSNQYEKINDPNMSQSDRSDIHGDIWVNVDHSSNNFLGKDLWQEDINTNNAIEKGELSWTSVHEEIAHSLGVDLYAPNNLQNPLLGYDPVTNPLKSHLEYLNSHKYTITSYAYTDSSSGLITYHPDMYYDQTNGAGPHALGLQLYDIAALQAIYGENTTTRAGDATIYTHGTNQAFGADENEAFVYTIWDGGGVNDTIDATGYADGVQIDLREGHFSSIGRDGNPNVAAAVVWDDLATGYDAGNVAIAYGTVIENATGTNEDDSLIGNLTNNVLIGGVGSDDLIGGGGDDTVDYSANTSGITITTAGAGNPFIATTTVNEGLGSIDNLKSIELIIGTDHDDVANVGNDSSVSGGGFDQVTGVYDLGDGYDTIQTSAGLWFDMNNSAYVSASEVYFDGKIHALNTESVAARYVVLGDLSIDNVEGNLDFSMLTQGVTYNYSSGAITSGVESMNGTATSIVGTQYDDTFLLNRSLGISGSPTAIIALGSGNDVVQDSADNTIRYTFNSDQVDGVVYSNGNDVIHGDIIKTVYMDYGITVADVSAPIYSNETFAYSSNGFNYFDLDVTYNITGHGTIAFKDVQKVVEAANSSNVTYNMPDILYEANFPQNEVFGNTAWSPINFLGDDIIDYSAESSAIDIDSGLGDDQITGTYYNDVIMGHVGNDIIYGLSGQDVIDGGVGDDELHGGSSNDRLHGGIGDDELHGGTGNDNIFGGAGVDIAYFDDIYDNFTLTYYSDLVPTSSSFGSRVFVNHDTGSEGYDFITGVEYLEFTDSVYNTATRQFNLLIEGTSASETLTGTIANELIYAYEGNDFLYGGGGDDIMYGGEGNDRVNGNDGNDTLYGDAGDDQSFGGVGNDTIHGGSGLDFLYGEDGDDTINGDDGNDRLYGNAGSDTLNGGNGNDVIYGHDGNDIIHGNAGSDQISGDAGMDIIFGDDGIDYIWGQADDDTIYGGNEGDTLRGGIGADTLYGDAGADILHGQDGNDTIYGGDDNDTVYAGNGDDIINGDGGNDTIQGNAGIDIINGGLGDDILIGNDQDDILNGDDGADYLYGGNGLDTLNGGAGIDNILGDGGNDTVNGGLGNDIIRGGGGHDQLNGDEGDDNIRGEDHNDTIHGNDGVDLLFGDDGADVLYGDAGNDYLDGGSGLDYLYGGAGLDRFFIKLADLGSGVDRIFDFNTSETDRIDLRDLLTGYNSVTDDINDFVSLTDVSSNTFVSVDTDGTGAGALSQDVFRIEGQTGLDLTTLIANGNILVE